MLSAHLELEKILRQDGVSESEHGRHDQLRRHPGLTLAEQREDEEGNEEREDLQRLSERHEPRSISSGLLCSLSSSLAACRSSCSSSHGWTAGRLNVIGP